MQVMNSICCPECRQNHIALHDSTYAYSTTSSLSNNLGSRSHPQNIIVEGISYQSFLQIGQQLTIDGGYDFLSDFSSELNSPLHCIPANNCNNLQILPFNQDSCIDSNEIQLTIHNDSINDTPNCNVNKSIDNKLLGKYK